MEEKIVEILRQVMEDQSVNADSSQANCEKWDSMAQLNIVVELEDAFGVNLEPEQIEGMKSVSDIVKVISSLK